MRNVSNADFRLRIADLNIKHIANSKSEIRNLHSEILSTPNIYNAIGKKKHN